MDARIDLERFARFPLGHWPTPLERLDRLSAKLGGARLLVKRDDCTGLAIGGNKTRKLEYLMAEAQAAGADTVITVGGVQSNHARQTAAAAARAGLACALVLPRLVDRRDATYEENGNVLLDRLLGAEVHLVDDTAAATARVVELVERSRTRGGNAFFIPAGGSTPVGALGYVRAAFELAEQTRTQGIQIDRIVLAASTAGTLAGLVVGSAAIGSSIEIEGIAVSGAAESTFATGRDLAGRVAELVGVPAPENERIRVFDGYLGTGYGQPSEGSREALELSARLEGLLLDPVYTAKAMAGLIDGVRSRRIPPSETVLFWHTGGTPALFAY